MLYALSDDAQGKRGDARKRPIGCHTVGHYAGKLWNIGNEPAVFLTIDFDLDFHGAHLSLTSARCPRCRRSVWDTFLALIVSRKRVHLLILKICETSFHRSVVAQ